ncbi:hypothetical protein K439DRAFT_1622497 [Ramaria rubella]|nr:hypothetical protein K439DRAFT_1622497 [Ramaria rubella]
MSSNTLTDDRTTLSCSPIPIFANLPIEIIREILEIVAWKNKSTATTLVRVSKLVRVWVTPILYNSVEIRTVDEAETFIGTIRTSDAIPGNYVRCLIIMAYLHSPHIGDDWTAKAIILAACPNIEVLVIKSLTLGTNVPQLLPANVCPGPREMVTLPPQNPSWRVSFRYALFRNLTHLFMSVNVWSGKEFIEFPCLSHLGFAVLDTHSQTRFQLSPTLVSDMLSSLPSLKILLLCAYARTTRPTLPIGEEWRRLSEIRDERLLAAPGVEEAAWVELVKQGKSLWDDAEMKYKDWRNCVLVAG